MGAMANAHMRKRLERVIRREVIEEVWEDLVESGYVHDAVDGDGWDYLVREAKRLLRFVDSEPRDDRPAAGQRPRRSRRSRPAAGRWVRGQPVMPEGTCSRASGDRGSTRPAATSAVYSPGVTQSRATPPGWFVGRPGQRHGGQWEQYAFDTTEKAHIGRRSREWTAVGQTEVECVREMARCLRTIAKRKVSR